MAWADADLKIFAAGLAIGGKWNNSGGSGSSSPEGLMSYEGGLGAGINGMMEVSYDSDNLTPL